MVVVPIVKNEADKAKILEACEGLHSALKKADIRVKLDDRLDRSPGFKFNDYEMRVSLEASVPEHLYKSQITFSMLGESVNMPASQGRMGNRLTARSS